MGSELAEVKALRGEGGEDSRDGLVQFADGELVEAGVDAVGVDAGGGEQGSGVDHSVGIGVEAADGELDDVFSTDGADELLRCAEGDDLAVVHDGDAVAEALGFVHVVGGEDDGSAGLFELVDEIPEMATGLGIEAGGGLIEEEEFRIADEGAGHGEALLLASGEAADTGFALFFELRGADGLFDRDAMAEEAAEHAQGFFDGEFFRELGFLKLDADALAELGGVRMPVEAEELDCAFVGSGQAFTHFDGGGLPCPVWTEQAKAFAARDFEVDAIDGLDVGVSLADAAEEQGWAGDGGFGG